jgi:glycosidase
MCALPGKNGAMQFFFIIVVGIYVLCSTPVLPQSEDGKWNKFGGRLAWSKEAVCSNNSAYGGTGTYKQTEDYPAAPNVDHTNDQVRKDIAEWLQYLRKSIGYDGWRFDFVKVSVNGLWQASTAAPLAVHE